MNSIQLESSADESDEIPFSEEEKGSNFTSTNNVINQTNNEYFDIPPPLEIYGILIYNFL